MVDRANIKLKRRCKNMAKSDWTGDVKSADREPGWASGLDQDFPVTARKRIEQFGESEVELEGRARATAEGLKHPAYIDYDVALEAYQSREDIETLQSKQTRNAPADFEAAGYMRALPNKSGGNGVAPDPDNEIVEDFF